MPRSMNLVRMTSSLTLLMLIVQFGQGREQTQQLGPVQVTTSLTPEDPVIGDEIVFEVRVAAAAHVEVLMPEFGEALDRYDILDFVPKQTIRDDGSSLHIQRYTLQPNLSGPQSIPPILIEFIDHRPGQKHAPDDFDAFEILTDRWDFTVQSVLPQGTAAGLRPALGELQPPVALSTGSRLALVALVAMLLVASVVAYVAYGRWRQRGLRKSAYELALQRLDVELSKPTPTTDAEIDAFFVAVSQIVRTYLEHRFDLRASDLTTEEFLELAGSSRDLSRAHQVLLRDFLRQADLVKFAGVKASVDDIHRAGQLARQFLEETRDQAPLVTVAAASPQPDVEGRAVA